MRRLLLFESVLVMAMAFLVAAVAAAQPTQPVQNQKPPVSLSPAMPSIPTTPTDPSKAETGGEKPPVIPVEGSFVLGPEDQITVTMWDDPRFNSQHIIRPDGKISIQLLGEIQAAGLTPLQLEAAIDKAALTMMNNPHVTVNVTGVHSKKIYFDGDGIAAPGAMDLVIPIHLLEAISARNGFKDFANRNKIHILRDNKPLLIDNGKKKTQYIRYKDMIDGKHPSSNPELKDGDHVIVP